MSDYNFQTVIDRRGTASLKWQRYQGHDIIPMWVADMDFAAPPAVLEALHRRIDHGVFGYSCAPQELPEVLQNYFLRQFRWEIPAEWFVWLPGIVPAMHVICQTFTEPGDEIATFVPVYPPFLAMAEHSGRRTLRLPLRRDGSRWTFDLEQAARLVSSRTKVLLLCSPHNPVGRIWTKQELRDLTEFCLQRDILICSDEIHCDFVLDDVAHVPILTLGSEVSTQTIALYAPSKTFNMGGLNCAFGVVPDETLRRRLIRAVKGLLPFPNLLGYEACLAAYRDGQAWQRALLETLRGNRDLIERTIAQELPQLQMDHIEATFLAWINCAGLGVDDPMRFFEQAGVGPSPGSEFGAANYVRINFGCPPSVLAEALSRIKRAVNQQAGAAS